MEKFLNKLDYDLIFNKLVEAIEESSLGSMLNMVGGKNALEPIKVPVKKKIEEIFDELSSKLDDESSNFSNNLQKDIEIIIDRRLDELTPEHIKSNYERNDTKTSWLVGGLGEEYLV